MIWLDVSMYLDLLSKMNVSMIVKTQFHRFDPRIQRNSFMFKRRRCYTSGFDPKKILEIKCAPSCCTFGNLHQVFDVHMWKIVLTKLTYQSKSSCF